MWFAFCVTTSKVLVVNPCFQTFKYSPTLPTNMLLASGAFTMPASVGINQDRLTLGTPHCKIEELHAG